MLSMNIENVDQMTPKQEERFWEKFAAELANDDGSAAREHLQAGFPIYIQTDETPKNTIEKRFPDGRRQLVKWDLDGEHVLYDLPTTAP
ncbi:hypothetical protein BSU04_12430 [Caballeronia sordidicola]|uniref:Uncharacterized protein n=2 Tax=Caballeronia sordidicola TaxID=196367 RepID=A0A226X4E7_CABSO|nr:hypothetical protein BSU04_12430 [Caballeronia sordidicola]